MGQGRRHVGGGHDLLGERLAALEPGGLGRRAEDGEACVTHHVGDPGDERCLGADDDEVDPVPTGELGDARAVEQAAGQRLAQGDRVHARVARGHDDRVDRPGRRRGP